MENDITESLCYEEGNKEYAAQKRKVINKNMLFSWFFLMMSVSVSFSNL